MSKDEKIMIDKLNGWDVNSKKYKIKCFFDAVIPIAKVLIIIALIPIVIVVYVLWALYEKSKKY